MIPGRIIHRFAAVVCSSRLLERVVEPAIADVQKEYAAGRGRRGEQVRVLLVGYIAVLKVVAICALSVSDATDVERQSFVKTLTLSVALITATTVLLVLPPLYSFDNAVPGWWAATLLASQAVPLAIPIGISFGIAFGLSARPGMNTVKMVLLWSCAAAIVSFSVLAWAMPASNRAFSKLGSPSSSTPKAYNEMSVAELRREAVNSPSGQPGRARFYTYWLHFRFSLAMSTVALVAFLLAVPVGRRRQRGLVVLASCFSYGALIYVGQLTVYSPVAPRFVGAIPVSLNAWLPNIGFVMAAILIASRRCARAPSVVEPAN